MSRASVSTLEIVVLSVWLGAAVFFSVAVAPALFAVLPTRTLAGSVVARLLPAVFYSGIIVGVVLLALQMAARRRLAFGGREVAAFVMIVACAVAQWVVRPRIERVRASIGGSLEALAPGDPRRAAFGRLHGISVAWLGLAMLAALAAMVIAARSARTVSSIPHP